VPFIDSHDDTLLFVKDWGRGRPVILMHGWPLSADTFDDLGMAIADAGMRAIAYDRRGFGRSEHPWGGYDYDSLSDDLAAVMDAVNVENATLIGFSMGGGEVARYMSRHEGANVDQCVLISTVLPFMMRTTDNPTGVDPSVFEQMAGEMRSDRAHFWRSFFKDFYGMGMITHQASDEIVHWSAALAMQASLKATLACAESFASTDFRPDLSAFRVPTLVIHGTSDKIVPIDSSSRLTSRAIPNAQLIEYDGAPHGLLATHKQQLKDDVLDFLSHHQVTERRAARLNGPDMLGL